MIDILTVIILLFFGFLGFKDGFVKNSFAIVALLIAIVAATKFMNPVGEFLMSELNVRGDVAITTAFGLIFVGIMVLERFIYGFRDEESGVFLMWDKIAAIWLGFLEGAAVVSLILVLLDVYGFPSAETQQRSFFYKKLIGFAPSIYDNVVGVLPESNEFYEELGRNFVKYRVVAP